MTQHNLPSRLATEQDFDFVYSLYMHPTINPYMNHDVMSAEDFRPIFKNEFLARDYFWIFESNKKDIGMCTIALGKTRMAHVANIGSLAIHPEMQGKKMGPQVMHTILDFLQDKGLKRITLGVEADNPRALALYQKFGFIVDGIFPKNFRRADSNEYIDHIMMSKWIGD